MRLFPAPLLLSAALLLAAGCAEERAPAPEEAAAQAPSAAAAGTAAAAPVVSRADFDLSDYEGEVVLLNFWATWCAPCRAEMPELVEFQKERGADGLQIIGVAMDQQGREAVAPYLERQPVNYPIVLDPTGEIGQRYGGVPALPTTLVIGPGGEVKKRIVGRVRAEDLRRQLEGILPAPGPAAEG